MPCAHQDKFGDIADERTEEKVRVKNKIYRYVAVRNAEKRSHLHAFGFENKIGNEEIQSAPGFRFINS